jgi:two-component system, OmpR family, phosphate regulon response regulator PhoB
MHPKTKKKKILVVSYEFDTLTFLTNLLRNEGFQVFAVNSGSDGISKAHKTPPALVILDVMMPGESGIHTYRLLKNDIRLNGIPVIMLSAIDRDTFFHYQKFDGLKTGQGIPEPEAFMEKPPEAEELIGIVNRLLQ